MIHDKNVVRKMLIVGMCVNFPNYLWLGEICSGKLHTDVFGIILAVFGTLFIPFAMYLYKLLSKI